MSRVSIFSNRLYDFDESLVNDINNFNSIIMSSYNRLFDIQFNNLVLNQSIHMYIKNKYNLNSYFANSIINLAKGRLKSQLELNNLYIQEKQEKLNSIQNKLKLKEKYLKSLYLEYQEIENYYIKFNKIKNSNLSDKEKKKEIKKLKFKNHLKNISFNNFNLTFNINSFFNKKVLIQTLSIHEFQFGYLSNQIQRTKAIISKLKYAKNNINNKIKRLNKKPKKIIWGSKKLINQRFDDKYFNNINSWKKELNNKRYKELRISGRKDAKSGNFVFDFDPVNHTLNYKSIFLKNKDESKKDGVTFNNIIFPYLGDELDKIILNRKDYPVPIEFGFKLKFDKKRNKYYIIFSASFEISRLKRYNDYTGDGVIGLDINFGHLDLCDISKDGNILDIKTIYYKVTDDKNKNKENLKKAILEVGKYVNLKHKPLVKERLDFKEIKNKAKYENKAKNKMIHSFPTDKIDIYLQKEKDKYEFEIFEINPAFTSIISRLKYLNQKKLNIHTGASFVIGRRALNLKEKVPKELKTYIENKSFNNYKVWSYLNKVIK